MLLNRCSSTPLTMLSKNFPSQLRVCLFHQHYHPQKKYYQLHESTTVASSRSVSFSFFNPFVTNLLCLLPLSKGSKLPLNDKTSSKCREIESGNNRYVLSTKNTTQFEDEHIHFTQTPSNNIRFLEIMYRIGVEHDTSTPYGLEPQVNALSQNEARNCFLFFLVMGHNNVLISNTLDHLKWQQRYFALHGGFPVPPTD